MVGQKPSEASVERREEAAVAIRKTELRAVLGQTCVPCLINLCALAHTDKFCYTSPQPD
jgi:hypothetical protein